MSADCQSLQPHPTLSCRHSSKSAVRLWIRYTNGSLRGRSMPQSAHRASTSVTLLWSPRMWVPCKCSTQRRRQAYLVCRLIVGIAGIPGSGKSTTATAVAAKINALRPRLDGKEVAVAIGMDGKCASQPKACSCSVLLVNSHTFIRPENGISCCSAGFHFYQRQLDTFPDPQQAHARRGAHFTFDADGFVRAVTQIRYQGGF